MSFVKSKGQQRGVGLIEVLVAVLVISVGLLGAISLQLTAKVTGFEAGQRAIASNLVQDLMERMRANPDSLDGYVVTWKSGDAIPNAATDCSAAAASCSSAELAAYDLNQWLSEISGLSESRDIGGVTTQTGGLVNPSACITHNNGFVTVAVAWRGVRELSNPTVSACGEDVALYGDANAYRQVLSFSTYVKEM